ncbi:hypothetical protein RCH16_000068 [Cryobacterium sp. MP_M5]|uniref:DUF1801 domain-containing protein n=1 Tax=unclassified Cryobacterium TaxID=2649013 RepID=UPI0018C8EDA5|nr:MULTISPECIES: DUF1801 domain-containing protein [unclassified Cryobacterium]MBG6056882.1 hypothetical protein [Cryobacterium sp. MP_M3]MEC5175081.1 hypothetical protein [Cryobacterium sp. MP_M5]
MSTEPVPAEVENYFADLEPDQRAVLYPVIDAVRDAMPPGYVLGMYWGMPGWVIPLETFPNTYNGQPLAYVSVAAQKNYNSLYLMGLYGNPEADAVFRAEWAATGRKLNMGKSCLRFKTLADVDLGLIARTVASIPVDRYLATYRRIKPAAGQASAGRSTRGQAPGASVAG